MSWWRCHSSLSTKQHSSSGTKLYLQNSNSYNQSQSEEWAYGIIEGLLIELTRWDTSTSLIPSLPGMLLHTFYSLLLCDQDWAFQIIQSFNGYQGVSGYLWSAWSWAKHCKRQLWYEDEWGKIQTKRISPSGRETNKLKIMKSATASFS